MKRVITAVLILTGLFAGSCIFGTDDENQDSSRKYAVSGTVTDSFGEGLPGVAITVVSGDGTLSASTDSSGAYSFDEVSNGSCTVVPVKSGYSFSPAQHEYTIDNAPLTGVDFTAYPVATVPYGSLGEHDGPNETITSGTAAEVNERVLTSFLNIIGQLEQSAAKQAEPLVDRVDGDHSGYATVDHTETSDGVVETDKYTGDLFDYSDDGELFIGGRLTYTSRENPETGEQSGSIAGSVGVAGAYAGTVSYDIEKTYGENGDFSGSYRAFSGEESLDEQITGEEFDNWEDQAENPDTFSIGGMLRDEFGDGVADVTVRLDGAGRTTVTDKEGGYFFGGVSPGAYTIVPESDAYVFTPSSAEVTVTDAAVRRDFTVSSPSGGDTYSIGGIILDEHGEAIPDVTVTLGDDTVSITDKEGGYFFGSLAPGAYDVTPVMEGYVFSPPGTEVTITDASVRVDFTGTAAGPGYEVSGRLVDYSGNGVPDVELSLTSAANRFTAVTDAEGYYRFPNVPDAGYGLLPITERYSYTPEYRTVIVSGTDVAVDDILVSRGGSSGGYSISGRFLDPEGNSIPDVVVVLDYDDTIIMADKEGSYYIGGLGDGDYRITPSLEGYAFSPPVRTVTIEGGDVSADFTGVAGGEGHAVRGRIVDQRGEGIAGIDLSLTSLTNRFTAVTDAEGYYIFAGVPDGVYGVLPSGEGYLFSPTYQNVTVDGSDAGAETFIGTNLNATYSITGRIATSDGVGLAGVTVTLVEEDMTTTTDDAGSFSFDGLTNGSYTVVPSKEGFTFSPARLTVIVFGRDTRADFGWSEAGVGQYAVYGRVVDESGSGIADVMVMLAFRDSMRTDKEGGYYFDGLGDGSYIVAPTDPSYAFSPEMQVASVDGGDVYLDAFVGAEGGGNTHSMLGAVVSGTGDPLADVTITLEETGHTITTDKEGSFFFGNLADGEYTVVPSLEGYTFSPSSRNVTIAGGNVFVQPFTGVEEGGGSGDGSYTISGQVTDAEGGGMCCVTMTLGGETDLTAVTDSEGRYTFTNIENGDYILTPMRIGTVFSPLYQTVAVRGGDVTVDFTVSDGSGEGFHNVEGRVATPSGEPIEGVKLTLNGGERPIVTETDSDGLYAFSAVESGMYVITATKDGYTFSPRFQQLNVAGGDVTQNFIGASTAVEEYDIGGRVITESGTGLYDVTVLIASIDLQGQLVGREVTGGDGTYSFDGMSPGDYTITCSRDGYEFDPESVSITVGDEPVEVPDIVGARTEPVQTHTASMTISTGGGTVWVRNDRGDEISLEFPPLSIIGSELITLTTLAEPPENPIAENIFAGVTIEPEGLLLNEAATLRVTFAEPPEDLDQATLFWCVEPDFVLPLGNHEHSYNSISGELYHFSTCSAGIATMAEVSGQIDKARLYERAIGKPAAIHDVNYGWQITRTHSLAMLHWAERSMLLGNDAEAEKAIEEAKKIVEEDAERFVDEVVPPANPCEDDDYVHALGKYFESLMLLGSEGSTYNKVEEQVKNVADQCNMRMTLDIDFTQTEQADDFTDEFHYEGTIVIYMPIFREDLGDFGALAGGGTLMLTGSGQADDCTWTKAGNVDVEVSGRAEPTESSTGELGLDLHITLTETWIYTQTTICPDNTWTQNITINPEPATFVMPVYDGHTFSFTKSGGNVQSTIVYTLHVPQSAE